MYFTCLCIITIRVHDHEQEEDQQDDIEYTRLRPVDKVLVLAEESGGCQSQHSIYLLKDQALSDESQTLVKPPGVHIIYSHRPF